MVPYLDPLLRVILEKLIAFLLQIMQKWLSEDSEKDNEVQWKHDV